MSRNEWRTIVCLLFSINGFLLAIVVYLRFLWNLQQKIWHQYWMDRLDGTQTKADADILLGDQENREQGLRSGDMYRPQG